MTAGEEPKFTCEGLGLIVTLVTSNIRSLRFCDSKVAALECLSAAAGYVSSETILDKILPYVVRENALLDSKSEVKNTILFERW